MAKATVTISATNKMSPAMVAAKKSMLEFHQTAQKVGNALKSALGIAGVAVAVSKLGGALKGAFRDFNEAERKYKQLKITLGDGESFGAVSQKIKDLSKITLSSKDEIESMVAELAGLGKSSGEIDRISEAAVVLSNVTGKDLNSAMTMLLQTYNGTTTSLKKIGIDTSDLTKEELEQGAAVQLVIDKFSNLSKQMAEDDSMQHIQNIKNNLGDIGQSFGDLVDFSISPLLSKLDEVSESLVGSVDGFVQKTKVVLSNLPEVFRRLMTAIMGGFDKLISVDGIKNFASHIHALMLGSFKMIGDMMANLGILANGIAERAMNAIRNLAMAAVTAIADSLGINISEVANKIGEWLLNSPIGKFVDNVVSKSVNGVRLVGNIIRNLPQIFKIVLDNMGDLLSAFFKNIPTAIKEIFLGAVNYVSWFAIRLKNSILEALENAIQMAGEAIQGTWFGKVFGLGEKLANVDLGIDRTSEIDIKARSDSHFRNVGEAFGNIGDAMQPMAKEIDDLLNPTFERFIVDNETSIGQALAKWSAKSTDEYLDAAKESFSDVGSFLSDWASTFSSDFGADFTSQISSFGSIFSDAFGDDMEGFMSWFRPFLDEKLALLNEDGHGIYKGVGDRATDNDKEKAAAYDKSVFNSFTSKMGEAGGIVSKLSSNMSSMGIVMGVVATALEYIFEGLGEVAMPMLDVLSYLVLEPLREIGRMLGQLIVPILEILSPILEGLGKAFITVVGVVEYVIHGLRHWMATMLNWMSSINLMGWEPFSGLRMTDPGNPGSLGNYLQAKYDGYSSKTPSASVSTHSAMSSASYQGATNITINIYQQGMIVGDNGMRAFARMVKDEFDQMEYYGATT